MSVFALTGYQKVGGLVVGFIVLMWLIFLGFQLFKSDREPGSEIETAPNRKPYYDDEVLETARLDRFLGFALFFLIICVVGLFVYFLNETNRQTNAQTALVSDAEKRGEALYTSFCVRCHAAGGVGGVAASTISSDPAVKGSPPQPVSWTAPPLNTVLLRYTDVQVQNVIEYGRINTPMPAWSTKGGGAMNDQNVTDLITYLHSIQLGADEAKKQNGEVQVTGYMYPYTVAPENNGELLFARHCARCHTGGWSYQDATTGLTPGPTGGGAYGPNLRDGSVVRQFPNIDDQIDFITNGAFPTNPATVFDGPLPAFKPYGYGVRGIGQVAGGGMPAFSQMLTAEQIRAIAEYERTLGTVAK